MTAKTIRLPAPSIEAKFLREGAYTGPACPVPGCGVVAQRTEEGILRDGLAAHLRVVHRIHQKSGQSHGRA